MFFRWLLIIPVLYIPVGRSCFTPRSFVTDASRLITVPSYTPVCAGVQITWDCITKTYKTTDWQHLRWSFTHEMFLRKRPPTRSNTWIPSTGAQRDDTHLPVWNLLSDTEIQPIAIISRIVSKCKNLSYMI